MECDKYDTYAHPQGWAYAAYVLTGPVGVPGMPVM
jgi:hypothetical protein